MSDTTHTAPARKLNILLITSEDNGQELSCYGDPHIQTPHLDRLAGQGACFENAYVTQSVCSPSRASILTGLYPHQNGQIGLSTHTYEMFRDFPNAASLLKGAGYRTGRMGKLHVNPESAFPFDFVWNDPQHISFWHRDVVKTAEVAEQFATASDQPFFLMLNYSDCHLPWLRQDCGLPERPFVPGEVRVPPGVGLDSGRLREHAANYYSCMRRLDQGIGLVLDMLERRGLADNTLVIYLADHGPQFSRGKTALYELATKVPFIVRWPGLPARGMRGGYLVSSIDILPTLLDASGVTPPAPLPGRSLRPLLEQDQPEWREHLFCEWNTCHPHPPPSLLYPQRSVRDGRYKLIVTLLPDRPNPVELYYTSHAMIDTGTTQWEIDHHPDDGVRRIYAAWRQPAAVELYDLSTDPWEFKDLAGDAACAAARERLLAVLADWREATGDALLQDDKLHMLVGENEAVAALAGAHKRPGFHYRYIDYLKPINHE